MRFDDMIGTILAQQPLVGSARAGAFRQLVDLLAQGRGGGDVQLLDAAYALLAELKPDLPTPIRARAAQRLAGSPVPVRLAALFADEAVRDVADFYLALHLAEDDWLELLPSLAPPIRALLRERRDLPGPVMAAIDAFGHSGRALTARDDMGVVVEEVIPDVDADRAPPSLDMDEAPFADLPWDDVAAETASEEEDRLAPESPWVVPPLPITAPPELLGGIFPDERIDPAVRAGQDQIRDLLSRIEAFRDRADMPDRGTSSSSDEAAASAEPPASPPSIARWPTSEDFRWESDIGGQIIWCEGIERAALVGRSIAVPAMEPDDGVDAGVVSAFMRRTPFRDARLMLPGEAGFSGEWRLSGVPFFDPRDGRFTGFRGTARRPRGPLPGVAEAPKDGDGLRTLTPDGVRQMVHELRTPLNAIMGFAEMIERQMLGPAASSYRDRAGEILDEARRLLTAVEDLDTLAQTGDAEAPHTDIDAAIVQLVDRYRPLARNRGVALVSHIPDDLPPVVATVEAVDRLVGRLLASVLATTHAGEQLDIELESTGTGVSLMLSRPRMLAGRSEAELLDPEMRIEDLGREAPALGLSFGLRLVRQLTQSLDGGFRIDASGFSIYLPAASGRHRQRGGAG